MVLGRSENYVSLISDPILRLLAFTVTIDKMELSCNPIIENSDFTDSGYLNAIANVTNSTKLSGYCSLHPTVEIRKGDTVKYYIECVICSELHKLKIQAKLKEVESLLVNKRSSNRDIAKKVEKSIEDLERHRKKQIELERSREMLAISLEESGVQLFHSEEMLFEKCRQLPNNIENIRSKVILLGGKNAGKSSLCLRYFHNKFNPSIDFTIGVDFKSKLYQPDGSNLTLKLLVWDTSGRIESWDDTVSSYSKDANVFILCYDITSYESFQSMKLYYQLALKVCKTPRVKFVIAACKSDLLDQYHGLPPHSDSQSNSSRDFDGQMNTNCELNDNFSVESVLTDEVKQFALTHNIPYIKVSGRTSYQVDFLFMEVFNLTIDQYFEDSTSLAVAHTVNNVVTDKSIHKQSSFMKLMFSGGCFHCCQKK